MNEHTVRGILLISSMFVGTAAAGQNAAKPSRFHPDSEIVKAVTENDLADLVRAEGHTVDKRHPFEAPSVRGKTKEGLLYVLIGTACDSGGVKGCQGAMMQVRYDGDSSVTAERLLRATMKEAALSVWWDKSENTVGFTRYVVLDDGVTWRNLRSNLRVLLAIQENDRAIVFDGK